MHATAGGHADHSRHKPERVASPVKANIGDEVVCPVDRMTLQVTADTPATEYRGALYYFCSDDDQRAFLRGPERYLPAGTRGTGG